jgi:alkaline phosphatase
VKKLICTFFLAIFLLSNNLAAQPLSFGMFTDVHYAAIPDNGSRKYSQSLAKLHQCIDTMNRAKVDFVIELGDFKDMTIPPNNQLALEFLTKIEGVFARFQGDRYHVLGNHDEDCISKQQFNAIAGNSRIDPAKSWYSFEKKGYRFIVLDACFDSTGRAYDSGNFVWSDANIPMEQLKWLEKELKRDKLPVVLFVHQLLYGNDKVTIRNAGAVREILEGKGQVKCVFHGHDHKGGYQQINGIHYYTLKGMIEGNYPESNSFAIVTLSNDKIEIKGFGNAISQTLPLP